MHARTIAAALTALAAVAVLSVPAFGQTFQVNVTEKNSTCALALTTVHKPHTSIVFHMINNGTVAHGLLIWGVHSAMIPPKSAGDIMVDFHRAGTFRYACLAGTYNHPRVIKRGIFRIRA